MKYRNDRTVVYRAERSGPGKWIFAAIVFILAMTITWSEVEGINVPLPPADSTRVENKTSQATEGADVVAMATPATQEEPTNPIPEPATILLMGAGVGAAYLMRKRKA